ncbi:hypothetical protein H6F38_27685 [Paenibacillus sp. EKM208P]|nr:hypothetical protein H6F38_27685 [Paenibacillus sp. EKM208P]
MQDALNQVQRLLETGEYNNAWKQLKNLINELVGSSEEEELKKSGSSLQIYVEPLARYQPGEHIL